MTERTRATGRRPRKARNGPQQGNGARCSSSDDRWILLAREEAEFFAQKRSLEARVAGLVAEGYPIGEITVYHKTSLRGTVGTSKTA